MMFIGGPTVVGVRRIIFGCCLAAALVTRVCTSAGESFRRAGRDRRAIAALRWYVGALESGLARGVSVAQVPTRATHPVRHVLRRR